MLGFLSTLFTGGAVKSVENIAKEWIDTPQEKAKAHALMVKTLDPNGLMRRNISQKVSTLYVIYLLTTMILVVLQAYGIGNVEGTKEAIKSLTDLFVPITTMFTAIVGASFGINGLNASKGR
jgi:hypothetical protein